MDVDFIFDRQARYHRVELNSEHQALTSFLNAELATSSNLESTISEFIEELAGRDDGSIHFTEWSIEIDFEDVKVFHHSIKQDQELTNETHAYADWHHLAYCGKGDLIELLDNWLRFIENV